jgi:hypothetical protein
LNSHTLEQMKDREGTRTVPVLGGFQWTGEVQQVSVMCFAYVRN